MGDGERRSLIDGLARWNTRAEPLRSDERSLLTEGYRDDIDALERSLGRDLSAWRSHWGR